MDVISEIHLSESSDLYQKLVVDEQAVDDLFAYFPHTKDPGLLAICARLVDPAQASHVRDEILATLAGARIERVDDERLADTKKRLRYALTARMDNSDSIGEILASFDWGELDLLLFDLPPGAERTVQYADFLRPFDSAQGTRRTSFVLVTIPSEVSRGVVARSIAALAKEQRHVLGYF